MNSSLSPSSINHFSSLNSMNSSFIHCPPQFPLFSTPFPKPLTPLSFPINLINSKHSPIYSLSSNATSFFLQNPSFPPSNDTQTNSNNTENVDNQKGVDNDYDNDEVTIKMPTAPWMKGPLLLHPDDVLDLSKSKPKNKTTDADFEKVDRSLTKKVSGRGKKLMKKLVYSIEKLQMGSDFVDDQAKLDHTQKNWGDSKGGGILVGRLESVDDEKGSKLGRKMPWEREKTVFFRRMKKEKVMTAAELSLDKELLERLRGEASKMRKWVKVKKAGVTQAVVDEIGLIWGNNELAMLKFDLPLCRNMDRAREIVELKTGGLVVWSKKDSLVVYRGCNYQGARQFQNNSPELARSGEATPSITSQQRSLYEREGDRLLDGLGPRFIDWWYPKPLPVDGDLLPEVVPGFKPPFRLCPPQVRPQLTDDELTYLRKLARPLPVHFVLGRNYKLQGLAAAILKLWEKSIIVKIAIKWGVQNTKNEAMASELKRLTGGVLLLRNKFFIILYRGKDFLPGNVANMVMEREDELIKWHLYEEDARLKVAQPLDLGVETPVDTSVVGTFSEFQHMKTTSSGNLNHFISEFEIKLQAEKERLEKEIRKQEHKLAILKFKIEKAEKELSKLNSGWNPSELEPDRELMTEEERECFRKIGQKMNRVLVLGRRGVFDGVIEGLHQHWKHREVAKVITMQKTFMRVFHTASLLERESGGILVSIDKLKKGHSIILYRGKNYKRPIDLGKNLLTKRKALKRSLEMQRVGSLRFFAHQREKEIADLRHKVADLEKNTTS